MKKLFSVLLVLMMLLTSVSALAEWPERSIELIVPANPGGDTDANARALAAAMNETLGWNVIVSNMAGGSGAVAFDRLKITICRFLLLQGVNISQEQAKNQHSQDQRHSSDFSRFDRFPPSFYMLISHHGKGGKEKDH